VSLVGGLWISAWKKKILLQPWHNLAVSRFRRLLVAAALNDRKSATVLVRLHLVLALNVLLRHFGGGALLASKRS